MVHIFKDMSCPISVGYTVFKTFYGLLSFLVSKYKVLENRAKEDWEKIRSCKVQTYWKLNPDITGKL